MVVKITEAKNGIEMSVSKLGQKGYIAKITGPDYKYKMARFFPAKGEDADYRVRPLRDPGRRSGKETVLQR